MYEIFIYSFLKKILLFIKNFNFYPIFQSMDENINIEPVIAKPDEILTGNVEKVAELINKYLPVEGSRLEVQESKKVSNIDRVHSPVPIESRNA